MLCNSPNSYPLSTFTKIDPFDGFDWFTLSADIDNQTERTVDIDISNQEIAPFTNIKGDGFFRDGTLELRYAIKQDGQWVNFKLVGTKI